MHPVLYFPIRFRCFWTTSIISKRDFVPDPNQTSSFYSLIIYRRGGEVERIARCFYLSFYIFISFYRYTVRQSVRYNSFSRRFPSLHLGLIFLLSGFLLLESVRRFLWSLSIFLLFIYFYFFFGRDFEKCVIIFLEFDFERFWGLNECVKKISLKWKKFDNGICGF